jgi:hypothetical protein
VTEARPPVWIGHVLAQYRDLDQSAAFWSTVGLRPVERTEHVAIFELRGGTHLILVPGAPGDGVTDTDFDLMVDDLDDEHGRLTRSGLEPSAIDRNENHRWFSLTDPAGNRVIVSDSHVVGVV